MEAKFVDPVEGVVPEINSGLSCNAKSRESEIGIYIESLVEIKSESHLCEKLPQGNIEGCSDNSESSFFTPDESEEIKEKIDINEETLIPLESVLYLDKESEKKIPVEEMHNPHALYENINEKMYLHSTFTEESLKYAISSNLIHNSQNLDENQDESEFSNEIGKKYSDISINSISNFQIKEELQIVPKEINKNVIMSENSEIVPPRVNSCEEEKLGFELHTDHEVLIEISKNQEDFNPTLIDHNLIKIPKVLESEEKTKILKNQADFNTSLIISYLIETKEVIEPEELERKEIINECLNKEQKNEKSSENLIELKEEKYISKIESLKLFSVVCDTSQSYKIYKIVILEQSIKKLKGYLPNEFQLFGLYGYTSVINKFLEQKFENYTPVKFIEEGFYLFFNRTEGKGALVYFNEDESLYTSRPIKTSSRLTTLIRILSDLCYIIVACISHELIKDWYFENKGKTNPFIKKTHSQSKAKVTNIKVQESTTMVIQSHKISDYKGKTMLLPKDSSKFLIFSQGRKISQSDIMAYQEGVNSLYAKLIANTEFNKFDASMSFIIHSFLKEMKFISMDFNKIKQKVTEAFDQFGNSIKHERKKLGTLILNIIQSSFRFRNKITTDKQKQNIESQYIKQYELKLRNEFIKNIELANELTEAKIMDELNKLIPYLKTINQFNNSYSAMKEKISKCSIENERIKLVTELFTNFRNHIELHNNPIEIKSKTFIFFNTTTMCSYDECIKNILKQSKKPLDQTTLNSFYKECIKPFKVKKIVRIRKLIKDLLINYTSEIADHKNVFLHHCNSIKQDLEEKVQGQEIVIENSVLKITVVNSNKKNSSSSLVCSFSNRKLIFKEFFKTKLVVLKQVISFEENLGFIIFSDKDASISNIISFNPSSANRNDLDYLPEFDDPDVLIAWGSSANKYILFFNTKKQCVYGALYQNKYMNSTTSLPVYEKMTYVVTSSYNIKTSMLYILENDGKVYLAYMASQDISIILVKSSEITTENQLNFLSPKDKSKFVDLELSADGSIILLRSQTEITCFDTNFKCTNSISLILNFFSSRTIFFDNEIYLLQISTTNSTACHKIIVPKEETKITYNISASNSIEGNPILDVWLVGLIKFGPMIKKTQIIKGKRYLCYFTCDGPQEKIDKYFKNLTQLQNHFKIKNFFNPNEESIKVDNIKLSEFLFGISTRTPLHVASIQNGNLVPMQNGLDNFNELMRNCKNKDFLGALCKYIRFGHFESVLKQLETILVISIIGKQSSGKSYLLNRLGGTRFDVAAERCTDGIWMGIGRISDLNVIFFDCEGLFTIERSTQEEMKLCLFLSSISDFVILNSDISSGKHINLLFNEFALGADRLTGKKLFKGVLDITYRDIPDNQQYGAEIEFTNFLKNLIATGSKQKLDKLFDSEIMNSKYHNFENDLFEIEIKENRNIYIGKSEKKWSNGEELSSMMKIVLAQIFSDDSESSDLRLFYTKVKQIKKKIEDILQNAEAASHQLPNQQFTFDLILNGALISFSYTVREFYTRDPDRLKYFKSNSTYANSSELIKFHHNEWYENLDTMIGKFFTERKTLIINYFKSKLPYLEEFKDQIDTEAQSLENILDKVASSHCLCLRKCALCEFKCTETLYHKLPCDCGTDHICIMNCSICGDEARCNLKNGHADEKHFCKLTTHQCTKNCATIECHNRCTKDSTHIDTCSCLNSHPCGKECEMFNYCGQYCQIDRNITHNDHDCLGKKCPFQCELDQDHECKSLNHFHNYDVINGNESHLCGKSHPCLEICDTNGVCLIETELVSLVHKNRYNDFLYSYVKLSHIKQRCKISIQPSMLIHDGDHICSTLHHRCDKRCPDCDCFCDLNEGHIGLHKSRTHRNKDCSEFISVDDCFELMLVDKDIQTTKIIAAGDSASPEICNHYCVRKGRGHSHPIVCEGKSSCLMKIYRGSAVHSNINYKGSAEMKEYDLVACETYWNIFGWEPPVLSINSERPEIQEIFGKCNFACSHNSHLIENEPSYCTSNIFHSTSLLYNEHTFKCEHNDIYPSTDIVFIIDCTGSMIHCFPEVRKVIVNLVDKWGINMNKFAIVGYTDHAPHNGHFSAVNPVSVFPSDKLLEFSDPILAAQFLEKMKVSGGGGNGGEAVIDGLDEANNLTFRKNVNRLYILIGDDSPHGSEFSISSCYPDGCPCGKQWGKIITEMKKTGTVFIIVKLNESMNKAIDLFQNIYGGFIKIVALDTIQEFEPNVTKIVMNTIEKNLSISIKKRNK